MKRFRSAKLYPTLEPPQLTSTNHEGRFLWQLVTSANSRVYYTTDGSDPRLRGGAVALTAQGYDGIGLPEGLIKIRARALQGNIWSSLVEVIIPRLESLELGFDRLESGSILLNWKAGPNRDYRLFVAETLLGDWKEYARFPGNPIGGARQLEVRVDLETRQYFRLAF